MTKSRTGKKLIRTTSQALMTQILFTIRGKPVRPFLWSLRRILASKISSKINKLCSKPSRIKKKQPLIVTKSKTKQSLSRMVGILM